MAYPFVQLSRSGRNADSCSDLEQIATSSFNLIKVIYSGVHTIHPGDGPSDIFIHSLGYHPMFFISSPIQRFDSFGVMSWDSTLRSLMNTPPVYIDGSALRCDGDIYALTDDLELRWYICAVDLFTEITEDITRGDDTASTSNINDVVKITKEGYSIDSTDLENYSVNSKLRGLNVDMIKNYDFYDEVAGDVFTFNHSLGYIPYTFSYRKQDGKTYSFQGSLDGYGVYASSTEIDLHTIPSGPTTEAYSVVVVKDPILLT